MDNEYSANIHVCNNLPIYEVVFDEESLGITAVSLVDRPAIECDFQRFAKQEPIKFYFNDEKREIVGPALIPEKLIYRVYNGQEFYLTFSKEVITDLAFQYFQNGWLNNVTLQHEEGETPFSCLQDGVENIHCWIEVPGEYSAQKEYGFDNLPAGTWFLGYKIHNDEIWNRIKQNEFKGFSIEAFLNIKYKE